MIKVASPGTPKSILLFSVEANKNPVRVPASRETASIARRFLRLYNGNAYRILSDPEHRLPKSVAY